ncbi:MAG: hypothetical protein HC844_17660 [Tabrizicola sp.]|nr:hypothetical protein [Tabrizicola sp.]
MANEAENQKPGTQGKDQMSRPGDRKEGQQQGGKTDKTQPQHTSDNKQHQHDGSKQRE